MTNTLYYGDNEPHVRPAAGGARDAVGPTQLYHELTAGVRVCEVADGFQEGAGEVWLSMEGL
ncbi:MAG: hypothetical protein QOF89_1104 [Acidobacteriota bacterium]|jgi:hypothetical protein|nr:hypothetical protein [Acidobacteriota bacterium]